MGKLNTYRPVTELASNQQILGIIPTSPTEFETVRVPHELIHLDSVATGTAAAIAAVQAAFPGVKFRDANGTVEYFVQSLGVWKIFQSITPEDIRTPVSLEIDQKLAISKTELQAMLQTAMNTATAQIKIERDAAISSLNASLHQEIAALQISAGNQPAAQITGSASVQGTPGSFIVAFVAILKVYVVLLKDGIEEGARIEAVAPGVNYLTPQSTGSYTAGVFTALTGGTKLAETVAFTVAAAPSAQVLTPITATPANASFPAGTAVGSLVRTLSVKTVGSTRVFSSDGRLVLDADGVSIKVGATAHTADTTIQYSVSDSKTGSVTVTHADTVAVTKVETGLAAIPNTVMLAGLSRMSNVYAGDILQPASLGNTGAITGLMNQVKDGISFGQATTSYQPQFLLNRTEFGGKNAINFVGFPAGGTATNTWLETNDNFIPFVTADGHLSAICRVHLPVSAHGHIVSFLDAASDHYYTETVKRSWGIASHQNGTFYLAFAPDTPGGATTMLGAVAYQADTTGVISLHLDDNKGHLRWTTSTATTVGPEFDWPSTALNRPGRLAIGKAPKRSNVASTDNLYRGFFHALDFNRTDTSEGVVVDGLGALVGVNRNLSGVSTTPGTGGGTTTPVDPATPSPTGSLAEDLDTTPWAVEGAVALPTTFVLENYATASSPGLARIGMPFKRGDVPSGSVPVIKRDGTVIPCQFDERSFWMDGSLKFAVAHIRDSIFAASTSRIYDVSVAAGSYNNDGTKSLLNITSGHDFKITFNSLTETNNANATTQVGSGSFTAKFNTHSAVGTRGERHHSGAVAEGWTYWGMATDNAGGAADAHLKVIWHVDIWKNADGTIYGYEVAGEPAQDWWSTPNKRRRNYDATLMDGSTTIESYPTVAHHYRGHWITCVKTGLNRGKRHWVGGAAPTLVYKPNKDYWVKTKLIAPYSRTFQPNAFPETNSLTYVPMQNFNQRPNIDGTGAYNGRGMNTNSDVHAFMRQTAADTACARINAHAGLHVHFHYRSNFQRTRLGETADIANTNMPFRLNVGLGTAIPYDFTGDGMPAPAGAYQDYRSSDNTQGKNGYTNPEGGTGVWSTQTDDSSHAVNYSGFMYMLEGERYHLEAVMDLASNTCHQGIDNFYSARPFPPMLKVAGVTNGGGQWDAIMINGQQRNTGFALGLLGFATAFVPQSHVASKYFKRWNRQQGRFLKHFLDFASPDILAAGVHVNSDDFITQGMEHSPWMSMMSAIGIRQNANMTENGYTKLYADHVAKPAIRQGEKGIYRSGSYRCDYLKATIPHHPTTNPFSIDSTIRGGASVSGANNTLTLGTDFTQSDGGWDKFKVGDVVYVLYAPSTVTAALPMNQRIPFYVVNVASNVTCQLSRTAGGSVIDIPADASVYVTVDAQWTSDYAIAQSPPKSYYADGYASIHNCVVQMAARENHPDMTTAKLAKWNTFVSALDSSGWVTWKMTA
jgi:hypothetical protein